MSQDDRVTQLYKMYGPAIYARCRRMLDSPAAAEDAAQETFVRVHRHLSRDQDPQEALRWIYRIATNYCLNEIRDRRHRAQPMDDLPEMCSDVPEEERLVDRDLARRLIVRAPEALRVAAWLYHVDGMDQDEAARLLGISRRTLVSRLSAFSRNARKFWTRSAA